jgi:hypothetical protein
MSALMHMLLLFVISSGAAATTTTYTEDVVWDTAAEIVGRVVVSEGAILRIEPGTVVSIQGFWDAELIVRGTLEAVGTDEEPIHFDVGPDNHYWSGIEFAGEEATGHIERCVFKNGRLATITCMSASPVIRRNTFDYTMYAAAGVLCRDGSAARIERNEFSGGRNAAILVIDAMPYVDSNVFRGFTVAVQVSDRIHEYVSIDKGDERPTMRRTATHPAQADIQPTCQRNTCEGCPELFLTRGESQSPQDVSETLLWTSPRLERGHAIADVVDLAGDGLVDIVVATWRYCEGNGEMLVYAQGEHEAGSETPERSGAPSK